MQVANIAILQRQPVDQSRPVFLPMNIPTRATPRPHSHQSAHGWTTFMSCSGISTACIIDRGQRATETPRRDTTTHGGRASKRRRRREAYGGRTARQRLLRVPREGALPPCPPCIRGHSTPAAAPRPPRGCTAPMPPQRLLRVPREGALPPCPPPCPQCPIS